MKLLLLSDLHTFDEWEARNISDYPKITGQKYDICVMLGDISPQYLDMILDNISCPAYGVYGNHDEPGSLEQRGIINLQDRLINANGVTFTGMSGVFNYKGNYKKQNGKPPCFLTQEESIAVGKTLPKADIFFTHDLAFSKEIAEQTDNAHCGLIGIKKYIKTHKPKYHFFGHIHCPGYYKRVSRKTIECCVYRSAIFDTVSGAVYHGSPLKEVRR